MSRLLTSLAVVAILAGSLSADEDPTARARQLFDSGRRHYDLAEYEAALDDFKEGYRLRDDPVFLYNIGLCHRLLGHKPEALRFFKNYLSRQPDAPNHADIERRVQALDEEIASEAKARAIAQVETPPSPRPIAAPLPPPPPTPPIYKKWWLWTAVGGVVAASVAVGLGVGLTRDEGSGRYTFSKVQF